MRAQEAAMNIVIATCIYWINREDGLTRERFVSSVGEGLKNGGVFTRSQRKRLLRAMGIASNSREIAFKQRGRPDREVVAY
ncbi:hypothetical protein JW710_01740 [Candidatus Dojkabacteria bacterium]|nr:hypothetical protein [Candidatus Dojkabacteria bacterium]